MTEPYYISSETTDLRDYLGTLVRPNGGMMLFCTSGYAILDFNFYSKGFQTRLHDYILLRHALFGGKSKQGLYGQKIRFIHRSD